MRYVSSISIFVCLIFFSFSLISGEDKNCKIENQHGLSHPTFCKASPYPVKITQADGSQITIVGKGNMNNYWTETEDGYTVIRNNKGIYEYANKLNGNLIPSGIKANDINKRKASEIAHLNSITLSIKPDFNPLKGSVLSQVNAQLKNKTFPTTGNVNVLALLIDYPDLDSTFENTEFDSLLYGSNFRNGDGSFKSFYETASNGQLTITVDVEGWFEADSSYIWYGNDSGATRAADLVREAVDAAENAGVDFSNYDNDNDGDVDGILAIHAGRGAEELAQGEYIWSHRWVLNGGSMGAVTYDGVRINDYMINPETRERTGTKKIVGIGVICHEFGHNLGLPDLYDTDDLNGGSEGIGNWGLMGGGGWLGGEHQPANFCAWSRVDLGWDNPKLLNIGISGDYVLAEASLNQDAMYRVNTSKSNEYFLLENRQKVGLDKALNSSGLAIWHINTSKANSFGNKVNGDENIKGIDLEEADGLNHLDNEINRGDAGDLFPGTTSNKAFNDLTNPNAKIDTGINSINSNLRLANITQINDSIFFSFGPAPGPPCSGPDTLKTATGTFTDGSGNTEYVHNQNCSWLIESPSGTINLNFTKFKTEPLNDSVTVYDGDDNTALILGSYSGTTLPPALTSSSTELYIEFNTNSTINDSGWVANYTTNTIPMICGKDTLTALSGTFTDGSAQNNYTNNLDCSWLIQPAGAQSITFGLDSLNTQINKDKIFVYDGSTNAAPLLGSYSGTNNLNTLTSSGGSIYVEFKTDTTVTDSGWGAFYNSSTSGLSCTGATTFTATSGTFDDGSGTNDYSNNRFCTWVINPPTGQIELNFTALKTEAGKDRVIIFDGIDNNATRIGSYSGSTIPSTIISSSNALYIEFRTNGTTVDEGWEIEYEPYIPPSCMGEDTLTTSTATFNDGSANGTNYGPLNNCTWLIEPTGAAIIDLSFNRFDTESINDIVNVYDGNTSSAPSLGSFSGSSLPSMVSSTGGSMLVEFKTNQSVERNGWEATYTSSNSFNISTNKDTVTINAAFGSTGDFDVSSNGSWTISDNAIWLIASPFSGTLNQTINLQAIQANIGPERYAEVYISATVGSNEDTVVVKQLSSGRFLVANPDTLFFEDQPLSSEDITLSTNVNWNLNSSASWLTIGTGSGTNNGTSAITAQNNTTGVIRTDYIVASGNFGVNNDTIFVVQDIPKVPDTLSVDPKSITLDQPMGSIDSFMVNSNVVWQTSVANPWLSLTLPGITSDTGKIIITANSMNPTASIRSSYVAIQDVNGTLFDTVFVNQEGLVFMLSSNPDTVLLPSSGGSTADIDVMSNTNWISDAGASWFSQNPTSGNLDATVTLTSSSANSSSNQRISFLALEDATSSVFDTVIVIQDTLAIGLTANPDTIRVNSTSGSSSSFNISTALSWTTAVNDPWITTNSPSGTASASITVTANSDNNSSSERVSFVVIESTSTSDKDTVYVIQDGIVLDLSSSPDTVLLSSSTASSVNVNISSNTSWIANSGALWFNPTPASGDNNGTVTLTTNSDNLLSTQRVSFLALSDTGNTIFDTVVVIQDTLVVGLTANPDTIRVNSNSGSTNTFTISTGFGWNATTNDPWISVNPNSSTGSSIVTVTANSDNPLNTERTTYVAIDAISGSLNQDTVYVIQEASQFNLTATPSNINLGFAAGSNDLITVNSNTIWNVTNPVTWLSITPINGSNDGSISVTANTENLSGSSRTATLTISATGLSDQLVSITQIDGSTPTFDISKDTVFVDNPQGSEGTFSILSNQQNWNLTEDTPWLLINPTTGSNTATISALVATRNISGNPRYAEVTAKAIGFSDQVVVIAQKESTPLFIVSPDSINLGPDSTAFANFNISSNLNSWEITEDASWFTVDPDSGGFTDQIRVEAIQNNNTSTIRRDTITIESPPMVSKIVIVTQDTVWGVGLEEMTLDNALKLYPNPTNKMITLEITNEVNINKINFNIFNIVGGQMPLNGSISSNNKYLFDLSGYSKGIYFIQIQYENKVITKKVSLIH